VEIIGHAVWLSLRLCLSFRNVEALMFERGVVVTSEAIPTWRGTYGQPYANQPYRRRPRSSDKWQMDEGVLTIKGERHSPWQAVDQDENIL
jgi:putative transposase